MVELLSETVSIENQKDLQRLLESPWYAEVDVVDTKNSKEASFAKCSDYLSEATGKTDTLRPYERPPYLNLTMMCRATALLLNAKNAEVSYIPSHFLDQSMPEKFPIALAFRLSIAGGGIDLEDKTIRFWNDIDKSLRFKAISKDQVEFSDDGGFQVISLVGRGDFNNDKLEDILISVQEAVVDGTYSNFRLLALSVNEKGEWYLIEEFKY